MTRGIIRGRPFQWAAAAVVGVALLLPGCSHQKRPHPAEQAPAGPVAPPQPPAGAAAGLSVPDPDAPTINSGIGPEEALWHMRSALNVAALSCAHGAGGSAIVTQYNALLTQRKAVLKTAYGAETGRFGSAQGALDRHMTQLYNFFAQPPAQAGFCAAAAGVADQAAAMPAEQLPQFAPAALARLEKPILDYYRAYAAYRRDLAAWHARPATVGVQGAAASVAPVAKAAPEARLPVPAGSWRIQIGAFTGQDAAKAAWAKAKARVPSLASYEPYYEAVPHSPLVRVQVGAGSDHDGALRLCATAAAGGFDCMPVGHAAKQ